MVQKYRNQPIISVMTGYQRYIAQRKNHKVRVFSSKQYKTVNQPLYNVWGTGKQMGQYLGNHMIINTYSPVGTISGRQELKLNANFVGKYTQKSQQIMGGITRHYTSGEAFDKITVGSDKNYVPSAEEQTLAVGGKIPKKIHKHANPVDIQNRFGNQQVTVQRLDEQDHHGIYGRAGDNLKSRIDQIRKQAEPNGMTDRDHQQIADAGLQYFQGRLPQWNNILARIQKVGGSADVLRTKIHKRTSVKYGQGSGFKQTMAAGFTGMMANSTGFFNEGAAALTQTALGNLSVFDKGVSYSFTIDAFKHAVLQKFVMKNKGGRILWDAGQLNKASVVEGYMATDAQYRIIGGFSSKYDVASRRAFAQNSVRADKNVQTTEVMKLYTAAVGDTTVGSKVLLPHIDMIHADKALAKFIKEGLIKDMQKTAAKDAKSFTRQLIGSPEEIQGVVPNRGPNSSLAWAAPYVGFADYSYEAFGV